MLNDHIPAAQHTEQNPHPQFSLVLSGSMCKLLRAGFRVDVQGNKWAMREWVVEPFQGYLGATIGVCSLILY